MSRLAWILVLDTVLLGIALTMNGQFLTDDSASPRPESSENPDDTEMWQATLAFGDPAISRAELLKQFEHIVVNYPKSKHQERAKDTVDILKQMVKEDREHTNNRKPFEQLGKNEQIAELIFQLRDQNGHQFSQPGHCDIFINFDGKITPAHRLVKMGYDAVPQLIEAIDDQRFTRSVGCHRNFYFSHHVLRVGDCALDILRRITARSFWNASSTFSDLTKDRKTAETKKSVQAWYEEFKAKGEKRMLIEGVERGDRDSNEQATLLVARYPDEALPPLKAGMKAARDSLCRNHLLASMANMKGDGPIPLLLVELREGPYAYGRLMAAKSLHDRGRPEGVAAMIAEWQGQRPRRQTNPGVKRDEIEEPGTGLASVADFLATCGEIKAILALEKDLRLRPVDLRLSVVLSFDGSGNRSMTLTSGGGFPEPGEKPVGDYPKEVQIAIERLLFGALDDTEERTGMSGSWDGKNYADPRICDVAGHVLNHIAPNKYSFDLSAPLSSRDRAIVDLKNVWRTAHGLAILPEPVPRAIVPVRKEQLEPLVEKVLESRGAEQQKAMAEIESLGLGALPGVQERLARAAGANLPTNRAILEKLVRRIACIIDEATLAENSLKPDSVVGKLKKMKGKPFETGSFMEFIWSLEKDLPKGVYALRFAVNRTGDGSGLTLTVDLLDETRAKQLHRQGSISRDPSFPKGQPYAWDYDEHVEVGKQCIHSGSGISEHASMLNNMHPELVNSLNAARSSPPTKPFAVRILLVADLGK